MAFGNTVRAIFTKDLICELRSKRALAAMIVLGVLIAWVLRITGDLAGADASAAVAGALFIAILFSAILSSERIFACEGENDCISALLLSPADAGDIYIAKLLVNVAMLCIFEILTVPAVLGLFGAGPGGRWLEFAAVLMLANVGICAAGTLLGAIVQAGRTANSLLGILVMAALCPMIMPVASALLELFGATGTESFVITADFNTAIGFLIAFDAIFVTVSWLLFGFVLGK